MLSVALKELKRMKVIQELFKEIDKYMDKWDELYNKYFKVPPNAMLGHIPLFVISTSYSQDNEVTGYKSYLKENFNENMFVNPYSLQVEALIYGRKFVQELEKLILFSRERKYTAFMYSKMDNKVYAPLVLTGFSYSEDHTSFTNVKVTFSLKEVNLLEFVTDDNGVTTTNVYTPESVTQNRELIPVDMTETMNSQLQNDPRMVGLI